MEEEQQENLNQNDKDFLNEISNNGDNIINDNLNENAPNIYNPVTFQTEILIQFFQNHNILKKNVFCSQCGKLCKFVKDNQRMDKYVWRCRGNHPTHDIKINIRNNSIFENMHQNIQILYFLLFFCFTEKKSLNDCLIETENFVKQVGVIGVNKQSISNIFNIIRNKIRMEMHSKWKENFLGNVNSELGYGSVEIDESEIIGNSNEIYWMFGIIDRKTKNARVFCVLNNRTKERLLPIIWNNVLTEENEENNLPEINSIKTRVYSDCFSSYQVNDFKEKGYLLKRVNHSIWFGYGLFHTNNIESLWNQIKRYTHNFSGISLDFLKNKFNNNEELIKEYLDGWICYGLFLRDCIRKKLNWAQRIELLCKYLK